MKVFREFSRIGRRLDLCLHHKFFTGKSGKYQSQLPLAGAVAPRGLNVIDPQFDRAANRSLQIRLILGGDVRQRYVLPFMLIAHAATGKNRDLNFGASKSSVKHGHSQNKLLVCRQLPSGIQKQRPTLSRCPTNRVQHVILRSRSPRSQRGMAPNRGAG